MKKENLTTRKLVMTAMLTCMALVLNTFVHFPAMAPLPICSGNCSKGGRI